ncbi:MAG: NUDIX hydrolase [bacterium]|nr:NUDIX domain-containing protein [Gammaproteobacteria bacterium]HIL97609.1 NUDIX domain-containing protein [Pseudomonadales bacterium]
MHRNKILALFKIYARRHPDESAVVERITSFVNAQPECFRRDLAIGHITGSAWVMDTTGTRVLLTHHKKLNIWVQLGGHADGDSEVDRVAYREAEEESGLLNLHFLSDELFDVDIHQIPSRGSEAEHYHYDCRFVFKAVDDNYIVSDESYDLAWVELDDVRSVTSEASILRMVEKTRLLSSS